MMNTSEKKKWNKKDIVFGIILIVLAAFVLTGTQITEIEKIIHGEYNDAEIKLQQFTNTTGDNTTTIEFWIRNTGDETAEDISVFVRAINKKGIIILSSDITITSTMLRSGETASGSYVLADTGEITHTIEIEWDSGRSSYSKTTS